jgi:hypothetical protein
LVRASISLLAGALQLVACQPTTTRTPITPYPEAAGTEVRLPVIEATRHLAEALKADSSPTRKVQLRDGYIETGWFMAATGQPAPSRKFGPGVVRVRAWADPSRPGSSQLTVETLYRPLLDSSLPERELERQVPRGHPVAVRVEGALKSLVDRYGGSPGRETEAAPPRARQPGEEVEGGDESE